MAMLVKGDILRRAYVSPAHETVDCFPGPARFLCRRGGHTRQHAAHGADFELD
jgi:hypothetical protein